MFLALVLFLSLATNYSVTGSDLPAPSQSGCCLTALWDVVLNPLTSCARGCAYIRHADRLALHPTRRRTRLHSAYIRHADGLVLNPLTSDTPTDSPSFYELSSSDEDEDSIFEILSPTLPAAPASSAASSDASTDAPAAATVLGADGTIYAVPLLPGATVGELWQALAAQDGTLNRTNYYLHSLRHLRLARTANPLANLADVLAAKLPGALHHLVLRFVGAPLVGHLQRVHDHLVIVPRQELITAFHPEGRIRATLSGDHNETAANAQRDYHGYVLLGPWVPRGTPLRARLRLTGFHSEGAGAKIGLVRQEAWDDVRDKPRGIESGGWTYDTYGHLYSAGPAVYNGLPMMNRVGGVVEVEVRWDAEVGVGELLYTIDGDPQAPARDARGPPRFNPRPPRDPGPWNAFQIPAEGGRVALAVSLQNVEMTLVTV